MQQNICFANKKPWDGTTVKTVPTKSTDFCLKNAEMLYQSKQEVIFSFKLVQNKVQIKMFGFAFQEVTDS